MQRINCSRLLNIIKPMETFFEISSETVADGNSFVLGEIREHTISTRYNDTFTNFQLALNVYFLNTTYNKENLDMLLNCCYVSAIIE